MSIEYTREDDVASPEDQDRDDRYKKLKRPLHAPKRSKTPARLRGMHRRRRKRMGW